MFTSAFWIATGERAASTFAQAALAAIGVGAVGFGDIDWINVASVSGVAAVLSILKSLVVNAATGTGPSVTAAEQTVAKDEIVIPIEAVYTPAD